MDAEIGIIGLGTMGSMAAWQLAKSGTSVIGFEQFGIGHDRSAAGGETRIFRTIYKEGSEYVPLLKRAHKLWRDLENESGEKLLHITKALTIGIPDSSMDNIWRSIESHNLDYQKLDYGQAKQLFPQHKLSPEEIIVVDPKGGYIRPQQAIVAAIGLAKELGTRIMDYTNVEDIEQKHDKIIIKANGRNYSVKKVLIAAGPWSKTIIPELNNPLEVRRLVNAWFLPKKKGTFDQEQFPVFARNSNLGNYYGIPAVDANMIKIGMFSTTNEKIRLADELNKNITKDETNIFTKIVKNHLPLLHASPSRINAYMEVYTNDKHPIIGNMPNNKNIVALTGFSGHGFKMAPVIGEIGASLLFNGKTDFKLDQFSPSRFL
ncbi:N-methyl-L-tryptophan oxidase [Virgibacillus sp. NKC19-16]|uniref:N-methyl-L-tryptophan oxidase n=1 Tax=Virgibacillus salidurans TaxID=2831673 RepID=UPI001F39C35C|nr:N-methyl-L-tryptophan oxidase [Virgibacillus sp. NKC19-16]UJL45798.1 N-methyl-L-tryptophan oxidase [Virgibacillus sp. NKC19-16]